MSRIPLQRLVCITGVSGSGKSTLVQDVLYPALLKRKGKPTETPGAHHALIGHERIADVVMVDQSPIGRTTRSNPASYVGAFNAIRELFARDPQAKERGYTKGTFSFNLGNGRCPAAAETGSSTSRCSFCPTCTCAARTATAGGIARRFSRSRSPAAAARRRSRSLTCST